MQNKEIKNSTEKNIRQTKGLVCSKCVHGTQDIDAFGPKTIECGRVRSEQLFMSSDGSCEHGRWFVWDQVGGIWSKVDSEGKAINKQERGTKCKLNA